jgi:hypothetical protein
MMSFPVCERCKKETKIHTMSWFNKDLICDECSEEEKRHPLFNKAKEFENKEVQKGNYNYPGIFSEFFHQACFD